MRLIKSHETRPVNLGNPVEMSVLKIAETVLEISGSGSLISLGPLPPGDPKRRCPDISRAHGSPDASDARKGPSRGGKHCRGSLRAASYPLPGRPPRLGRTYD